MTIRQKLTGFLLLLIVINLVVGVSVFTYIKSQDDYATYINLAGRQRALSQKMAKEALLAASSGSYEEGRTNLDVTYGLFERTLEGFLSGDREQNLTPVKEQYLREQAENLLAESKSYYDYLHLVAAGTFFSPADFDHKSMDIFQASDDLTTAFEQRATQAAQVPIASTAGGLVIVVILTLIGWFFTDRQALVPLAKMVDSMEAVASGNLKDSFTWHTSDEIGRLSSAFSDMTGSLSKIVTSIQEGAEELFLTANQVSVASNETSRAAEQTAIVAQSLAEGAEEQARNLGQISEAIEDVSREADAVAGLSDEAVQEAGKADSAAQQGNQQLEVVTGQMERVGTASLEVTQVVGRLGESSQQINDIVKTITEIAEQTNLLALNAAIEAARAGEQGRGFAVVAQEVRKLAENSATAAKEITQLVGSIQTEVAGVIKAMKGSDQEIQLGIKMVDDISKAFTEIRLAFTEAANKTKEVSVSTLTIAGNTQKVNTAVANTSASSTESAAAAEEVAAVSQEQNASMEELASLAERLFEVADGFKEAVTRFKV
ncbi:MAG: methyl-accepting chemotaxis protein [Bacillota bacterium]